MLQCSINFHLDSLQKIFAKWADVYVSLSKQIDGELIVSIFAKNKIIRLPNGFDTSAFSPLDNLEEKSGFKKNIIEILTIESFANEIGRSASTEVFEKFSIKDIAKNISDYLIAY